MELTGLHISFLVLLLLLFHLFSSLSFDVFSNQNDEDVNRSQYPSGFLFGTSTSSYQVEGGYLEDGKGLSNWDFFSHIQGKIVNNDNGDVADDHYHRFLEDIEIMQSLGVNAYRFSISWARILPRGRFGELNPSGIMFYNNVIDHLLLRGIEPFVTIFHFDSPQELEDRYGSWLSPLIQEDFVHFAKTCFENFGDRVKYWATINEPNLLSEMGYVRGWYPPAHCSAPFGNCSAGNSDVEPLIVMHNMLLSHAKAVQLYREQFQPKQGGSIGIIASSHMYEPLRDEETDQKAVNRILAFNLGWMFDPLVYGVYPPEMRKYLGNELPRFSLEETKLIKGSTDFIGVNHYSTLYATDCIHSACSSGSDHAIRGFVYTTGERDGIPIGEPSGNPEFFVVPEGMEKLMDYIKERYKNMPIYVTENGYAPPREESRQVEDLLQDVKRIEYHKGYLAALARAIRNGADVRGYFVWSLMDNLEWTDGFGTMFGLYYVDRQTLDRTPKLSARWYRNFLTNITAQNDASSSKKKISTITRSQNRGVQKY
ncbi:beta-glucosidase 18-like isoform X2 [Mangifera indica]|uniref:beta-glucosidase 18-like isoform X2 n=1 Tax=Mangifera indica TaxID=29780 RepID=UPI001CF995BD|nr:beta-glucosidase 18-like isoform X2 [Mangifera indica]